MSQVLVDTSVWVAHFRQRDDALVNLLQADKVLMHPMVSNFGPGTSVWLPWPSSMGWSFSLAFIDMLFHPPLAVGGRDP